MSDANFGIYYIVNKVNGHKYIGSSVDIERRWREHKCMLREDRHYNIHLQRAWNKYREDAFEFKIMAYTDPDKAVILEDFILQNYFDRFEYNIAESAIAPMLGKKFTEEHKRKLSESHSGENNPFYSKHHAEETKEKMSKSALGENNPFYGKRHSKETKHKLSKALSGENNPWYGKHLSEETKQKLSEAMSGRTPSEEAKQKMSKAHLGDKHHMYGKHLSEETKQKLSEAMSGRTLSEEHKQKLSESFTGENNPRWVNISDEKIMTMKSLREQRYSYQKIADIFGVSKNTVRRRLNTN